MSQKINAIVFSTDKAAQLRLFLDSVIEHAPDVFDLNIIINHTTEYFDRGYGLVVNDDKYKDFNFIMEQELREQVLKLLKSDHSHSCFFLDDDIIYKDINLDEIVTQLESDDDIVCFSLRLGENVTKCYTLAEDNVQHEMKKGGDFMTWDWSKHYLDFGYPFAMDGHIFRAKDIYKLTRKSKFHSVESLEMALFEFTENFPRNLMTSYIDSRVVGVPIGRVQLSIENEMTMTLRGVQAKKAAIRMNEQLLKGEAPGLDGIDFLNIEGCHQELDLGFTLDEGRGAVDAVAAKKYGKLFDDLDEGQQGEINKAIDAVAEIAEKQKEDEQ